jgi:hypothetical protein
MKKSQERVMKSCVMIALAIVLPAGGAWVHRPDPGRAMTVTSDLMADLMAPVVTQSAATRTALEENPAIDPDQKNDTEDVDKSTKEEMSKIEKSIEKDVTNDTEDADAEINNDTEDADTEMMKDPLDVNTDMQEMN